MTDDLHQLVDRLERAARELRDGDLEPDKAAALVEDCARLAAEAASALDAQARAVDPAPGQGELL
jgi:hypothetical protein